MSADIFDLADRRPSQFRSESPHDAIVDIALRLPGNAMLREADMFADWLLNELRDRGFVVVRAE